MKWLIGSLLVLVMVTAAFAGEDPYIAVVGNDIDADGFYFSPKYQQFLYDQTLFSVPVCFGNTFPVVTPQTRVGGAGCEQFRSNSPMNQPEICDTLGVVNGVGDFIFSGQPNAVVRKQNAGFFEWFIRLPKKPDGEINIVIQCGVLKPNAFAFEEFDSVLLCAAETGERIGTGFCTRDQVDPGVNPIINAALPTIFVNAHPGPYSLGFGAFYLTAYKNPSAYTMADPMINNGNMQILDGSTNARVLLKTCMDKAILAKIPVTDQINALGETESDLEAGDLIFVRLDIPITNTVDIYCHAQSVRLQGIGESPF